MVEDVTFRHKINYVTIFQEILNLEGHLNHYYNFAEWMDFAYRWSFSDGEFAINGATPSSFLEIRGF